MKKAYRFTCTRDGKIESDRQCEYVRPIAFGLLDGEENQQAAVPVPTEIMLPDGRKLQVKAGAYSYEVSL